MAQKRLQTVDMKIGDLHPYKNNPRHNKSAVDAVAESISRFGFKVPLVIEKDGTVVTGHTRLLAAQKLGLEKVPCIIADDLTDEQARAFRLADNKVSEFATWDWEKLENELLALGDESSMESFGFGKVLSDEEFKEFFTPLPSKDEEEPTKDELEKFITCPCCGGTFAENKAKHVLKERE